MRKIEHPGIAVLTVMLFGLFISSFGWLDGSLYIFDIFLLMAFYKLVCWLFY